MKKYFLATVVLLIAGIVAWNFFYKVRSAEQKTPFAGKATKQSQKMQIIFYSLIF